MIVIAIFFDDSGFICHNNRTITLTQSSGAVEYTDRIAAEV